VSITVDRGVRVTMPDGISLAADVYRPLASGRVPVVLLRTPYDRADAAAFGLQVNAISLADAGYAVVIQDVRGRYGSGGTFDPFRDEGPDGAASVLWAAEQSWSDGRVAMAGMSYCGYAQVLAARQRPEPLRAWIPAFCPLDVRNDWVFEGDAFLLAFNLAWMLRSVVRNDPRISSPDSTRVAAAFDAWDRTVRRPLDEMTELDVVEAGRAFLQWLHRRDDAAWWEAFSGRGAGRHDASALVVGGWFDLFAHGTFALHNELLQGAGSPVHLLVGPWDHSPLPLSSASGDSEFGLAAAIDLPSLELRWLDHVLRDGDAPFATAARAFVTGVNQWMDWDAWPPKGHTESFYTAPGGRLAAVAPAPDADRVAVDPECPVPSVGGLVYPVPRQMRSGQLPQDGRAIRPDVLHYVAEPAARDVLIAGPVQAEVWSSTTARGADVVVTVVDVAPDGRSVNLVEGARRLPDAGSDPRCFSINLGHVAHVVRLGHRLGVQVAGSSFPRIDRFPSGRSDRMVFHGGPTPSLVRIPVVGS
jgi:uncharacterized protein